MIPWLFSVLDYEATPETYRRYDEMSAKDMFKMYGVSKAMYEGFIKPTLLVALFAPPEVRFSPSSIHADFHVIYQATACGPHLFVGLAAACFSPSYLDSCKGIPWG